MNKTKKRVAIGMSGGVDSSLSASILKDQGYDVTGVFIEAWDGPGCRTQEDRKDALKVATKLGISFKVLDYKSEYRARVIDYFYESYKRGLTPNPDIVCNREIKFGLFYDWAISQRYDYVATGHYAQIIEDSGKLYLASSRDKSKDQSYFLHQMEREKFSRVIFPVGDKLKSEVREKASELNLHVSQKPDSMGVCFIGDVDVKKLLEDKLGENPGDVVFNGAICGRHRGLWFHTIGERGGFEVDKKTLKESGVDPSSLPPLYVTSKDRENNILHVGTKDQAMTDRFSLVNFQGFEEEHELVGDLYVRVRNLGDLVPCRVEVEDNGVKVMSKNKIFGVSEGQGGVLYREVGGNWIVVGGGVIARS